MLLLLYFTYLSMSIYRIYLSVYPSIHAAIQLYNMYAIKYKIRLLNIEIEPNNQTALLITFILKGRAGVNVWFVL